MLATTHGKPTVVRVLLKHGSVATQRMEVLGENLNCLEAAIEKGKRFVCMCTLYMYIYNSGITKKSQSSTQAEYSIYSVTPHYYCQAGQQFEIYSNDFVCTLIQSHLGIHSRLSLSVANM